jgi:TPR repeat protein
MTRFDSMGSAARSCDQGDQVMCRVIANNLPLIPSDVRDSLRTKAQGACDQHIAEGCWQLGLLMIVEAAALPSEGDGRRALQKAKSLFHDACQSGSTEACRQIIIDDGWLSPLAPDKPKLVARMKQLCDANLATACFSFGQALQIGFNHFPLDPVQGREALAKGCNLGEARACDLIARALEAHDMEWSGPKAFPELFTIACDRGSDGACVTLAERYTQDPALPQALEHAAKAWETGCSLGNGTACAHYAQILLDGVQRPADPMRAKALFVAACPSGPEAACFSASTLLLKGEPDVQDLARARDMLLLGCFKGPALECAHVSDVERHLIAAGQHISPRGPVLVQRVEPAYPQAHAAFRSEVQFTVSPDGVVKGCSASGAGAEIDGAVCAALSKFVYVPAIDNRGINQSTIVHMMFAGGSSGTAGV